MAFSDRQKQYQEGVYQPELKKHVAKKIRFDYPEIPETMTDEDVLKAHRRIFGADLDDESYFTRVQKAYASGFEPSQPEPTANLIEQAQEIAPQLPQIGGEMVKSVAPFLAGQVAQHGIKDVARIGGRFGGAVVPAAAAASDLLAAQMAGTSLEKTAAQMPQPNIMALKAKGYTQAQIENILRGYAETQKSLMEDVQKIGEEGVTRAATGVAETVMFPFGGKATSKVAEQLAGQGLARAGAKAAAAGLGAKAAGHTASGMVLGAGFGATQGAVERMAQANAAGLGADDIWRAGVEGGFEGLRGGAVVGGILGGVIGVPVAAISTGREAMGAVSAMRKAQAAALAEDAVRVNLRKFADDFRASEVENRFPEEVRLANGDDLVLVNNIVKGLWGEEVAASEAGMRAASRIYEKLIGLRKARAGISGRMVDLDRPFGPQPVEPMATQPLGTPEIPGGMAPEPGLPPAVQGPVGDRPPTFVPPTEIPKPPVGMEVLPEPAMAPETPLTLTGVAPEKLPNRAIPSEIGPVLGALERGGVVSPAEEIAPRLQGVETPAPRPGEPIPLGGDLQEPGALYDWMRRVDEVVERGGKKEKPGPFVPSANAPAEGFAAGGVPLGRTIKLPTEAEAAIEAIGTQKNAVVKPYKNVLMLEQLGVTAKETEKGATSATLDKIIKEADARGLPIVTSVTEVPGPKGGKIPLDKLVPWYEAHGFKAGAKTKSGHVIMRRDPVSLPAAPKPEGPRPPSLADRVATRLNQEADAARARLRRGSPLEGFTGSARMIADTATVVAAEMFTRGLRGKRAVADWLTVQYGREIQPLVDQIYAAAQKRLGRMFSGEPAARKALRKLLSLRESGAHGMNWYEETATWVAKEFSDDSDMFLRFLAATSANSSTEAGATLALKAYGQWKQGIPFDGMRGTAMVKNLEEAVAGKDFGGDKVASFYRALRGDKDAVVLDRWMIRSLGLPMKKGSLGDADYRLYEQIVRNLAKDANMTPRQFQAAIWEGARVGDAHSRWKSGGRRAASKIGSALPLEQIVKRHFGGMTPYQWVEANKMTMGTLKNMTEGIKAAREEGGFSFNPETWEADKTPGYIVTLVSNVVPKKKFYPAALTKFRSQMKALLKEPGDNHLSIGTWNMGENKPGHYSLDLNVVIPNTGPEALAKAKALGLKNRQFEIGEIGPDGKYVQGHKTGFDPKKHGEQFVPPNDPKQRLKWKTEVVGRARGMLDELGFKLTSEEGVASRSTGRLPRPTEAWKQRVPYIERAVTIQDDPPPPYADDAAFIFPDGRFTASFSDRDHSAMYDAMGIEEIGRSTFFKEGFIRINENAVEIWSKPTDAQRRSLARYLKANQYDRVYWDIVEGVGFRDERVSDSGSMAELLRAIDDFDSFGPRPKSMQTPGSGISDVARASKLVREGKATPAEMKKARDSGWATTSDVMLWRARKMKIEIPEEKVERAVETNYRRSGAPIWFAPDGTILMGKSHESVSDKLARAAKLTEKKSGYKGLGYWQSQAMLNEGFVRAQVFPERITLEASKNLTESQRAIIGRLAKKRSFEGLLVAPTGDSPGSKLSDSWTKFLREAEAK